mmetsp:Transcript_27199/g.47165  ORF Transcript_27199/g.47165 Transcript_27199/m.47165 type:complete len:846 (-) Transcript_27199:101-2638(-)
MRAFVFNIVCLACAGHGRRVQTKGGSVGNPGPPHTVAAGRQVTRSGLGKSHIGQTRLVQRVDRLAQHVAQLRGGAADEATTATVEDEEQSPLEEPLGRMRLVVAAGTTSDPSLVEISAADAKAMGLEDGDYVTLRGKKQRRTTCVVVVQSEGLEAGEVRLSSTSLANIGLDAGADVICAPEPELAEAERVLLLPFASDMDAYDGTADEAFTDLLAPYLKDNDRPLTVGDIIHTSAGDGEDKQTIRWKVLELEPEAANPIEVARGIITADTSIFSDGEPLPDSEASAFDDIIGYEDIGGLDKQLDILRELIDLPLRHPNVFNEVGVRPPRGVLLLGPPGSGKTMVANAIKNEAGVFFQTVSGPEIVSKKQGEGEEALRKIFENAEENSPSIVFIDEIDAVAPKRDKAQGEAEKRIVSQLLTLMDGIKPTSTVIVVAATNQPSVIDPALRRFGRFDREMDLGAPDQDGRLNILLKKTRNMRMHPDVNLAKVAEDTHGYTGADLSQLVTEAAMQCVRERAGDIDVDAEDVDPEILNGLMISKSNLDRAMNKCSPSSLRDKAVEIPDVSWEDVGGLLDVKREMVETLMYPLKYARKYTRYGMAPSKGILLYGPSGCGKTLVAKAIANEIKSNFISVKGPELLSMWFGESESNVRQLFDKARGASPCILFFDEIDSIAKPRGSGQSGGGEAGDRIVNQILTEIDGVGAKKSVFVIAATNRPDMLDPAIMRPGRLDQLVYLPLPDLESRVAIFQAATRKSPLAKDISLQEMAERTEGFSGADITELCQRACKLAIRQNIADSTEGKPSEKCCDTISKQHFEEAFEKARTSVSSTDVKKFERFQASMKANGR